MTIFSGASGPLKGAGSTCRVTISVEVAAKLTGGDPAAGAVRVSVRSSGICVVLVDRRSVGDCSVEALLLKLPWGIGVVEVGDEALRDNGLDPPSAPATRGGEAVFVGADVLEAVSAESASGAADGSLGNAGFWSASDAIALSCAPPVLCTTPVGGSGVADESADDGLPVVVDVVDVEVDADDELEGGLDGLLLSVDEEADAVDVPEDEELVDELESDGSATATPGMVATAEPTPSATANAPTRPIYLTCPIMAPCWMGFPAPGNTTPSTISKGSNRVNISGSVNIRSTTEFDCVRTLPTPASPTSSAARMKPFTA